MIKDLLKYLKDSQAKQKTINSVIENYKIYAKVGEIESDKTQVKAQDKIR